MIYHSNDFVGGAFVNHSNDLRMIFPGLGRIWARPGSTRGMINIRRTYNYPDSPNPITKRKYYDLIQNIPLFIPDVEMGDNFSVFLDKYPVSPYLCSRDSFMRWVHFIITK